MNHYPHHIGDYLKDTAHLTLIEDGAYRRLIDLYYQREQPLPADKKQIYRLARASTAAEKKAINTILDEFFSLTPDGYQQSRCDEEISIYQQKSDDADGKRENERERQRRHRERRAELFEILKSFNVVPPWNAKTTDLETLVSQCQSRPVTRDDNAPVTCDTTAIPIANNQEPIYPLPPVTRGPVWQLPDWIPENLWRDFEDVRKKRKKPMTDRARSLAVKKLDALRCGGHDVSQIIEQSILHCWDTFYAPKTGSDAQGAASPKDWDTDV